MPSSILEAIKLGVWDFEPAENASGSDTFRPTEALPGSDDKLSVLAERVRLGLPLWHDNDRLFYESVGDD